MTHLATLYTSLVIALMTAPLFSISARGQGAGNSDSVLEVSYPISKSVYFSQRRKYFVELLELALTKSGQPFQLNTVLLPQMSENRSNKYLQAGRYDVHWLMTNNNHEADLLPVRIPLYKGLIGWRLMLIHKDNQKEFASIDSLAKLKEKKAVHGLGWPDTNILVINDFNLRTSLDWLSLYRLLESKQADYFPRGVVEITNEINNLANDDIVIEEHLALRYYAAYYFFVHQDNQQLAHLLERGLNLAIEDGSFDALFNRYFATAIASADLNQRLTLHINNPLLPAKTPLKRKELWFAPH